MRLEVVPPGQDFLTARFMLIRHIFVAYKFYYSIYYCYLYTYSI